METYICEYCEDRDTAVQAGGDVVLAFTSGRSWIMPDLIPHLVEDHGWSPPPAFIDDVLNSSCLAQQAHPKNLRPQRVGYVGANTLAYGYVPPGFLTRLRSLVASATKEQQVV